MLAAGKRQPPLPTGSVLPHPRETSFSNCTLRRPCAWLKTSNEARTIPNFDGVPVEQSPRVAMCVLIVETIWKVEVVNDVAGISDFIQPVGMLLHKQFPVMTPGH